MRRKNRIDDRDWGRKPLFSRPRRGRLRWWLLLVLLVGGGLYLFPGSVAALLGQLIA